MVDVFYKETPSWSIRGTWEKKKIRIYNIKARSVREVYCTVELASIP